MPNVRVEQKPDGESCATSTGTHKDGHQGSSPIVQELAKEPPANDPYTPTHSPEENDLQRLFPLNKRFQDILLKAPICKSCMMKRQMVPALTPAQSL